MLAFAVAFLVLSTPKKCCLGATHLSRPASIGQQQNRPSPPKDDWTAVAVIPWASHLLQQDCLYGALDGIRSITFDPIYDPAAGPKSGEGPSSLCVHAIDIMKALKRVKRHCGFPIKGVVLIEYPVALKTYQRALRDKRLEARRRRS
ncbi:MAG TPA: hypothetical protein VGL56_17785 [Fimbriimonadaceae bacterium]